MNKPTRPTVSGSHQRQHPSVPPLVMLIRQLNNGGHVLLTLFTLFTFFITTSAGQIFRQPSIREHPRDTYLSSPGPVTLNCKADGVPTPTIQWFKDDTPVLQKPDVIYLGGDLFILMVKPRKASGEGHTGTYYCTATNLMGTVKSHEAKVEIKSASSSSAARPPPLPYPYDPHERHHHNQQHPGMRTKKPNVDDHNTPNHSSHPSHHLSEIETNLHTPPHHKYPPLNPGDVDYDFHHRQQNQNAPLVTVTQSPHNHNHHKHLNQHPDMLGNHPYNQVPNAGLGTLNQLDNVQNSKTMDVNSQNASSQKTFSDLMSNTTAMMAILSVAIVVSLCSTVVIWVVRQRKTCMFDDMGLNGDSPHKPPNPSMMMMGMGGMGGGMHGMGMGGSGAHEMMVTMGPTSLRRLTREQQQPLYQTADSPTTTYSQPEYSEGPYAVTSLYQQQRAEQQQQLQQQRQEASNKSSSNSSSNRWHHNLLTNPVSHYRANLPAVNVTLNPHQDRDEFTYIYNS